jgi:hypothetical protein
MQAQTEAAILETAATGLHTKNPYNVHEPGQIKLLCPAGTHEKL